MRRSATTRLSALRICSRFSVGRAIQSWPGLLGRVSLLGRGGGQWCFAVDA